MVGLAPLFEGDNQLYAYAIGVVAGTLVQLLMMLPTLRRMGFPIGHIRLPRRDDERVRRVLLLMLPVSIGLGLININLLLNTVIGSGVSDEVPRAIDAAFRIYMLPQGMFSVAVATVLFPQLARLAARADYAGMRSTIGAGMRQIALLLIPAGAAMAVLAEPIVRLVFERGEWDAESTRAHRRRAVLVRVQPPVQRLGADAHARVLLAAASTDADEARRRLARDQRRRLLPAVQAVRDRRHRARHDRVQRRARAGRGGLLRRALGGFETRETLVAVAKMLVGAGVLAAVTYGVWYGLDALLGDALIAQIVSVFTALALGSVVYAGVVLGLQIPEARQILDLFARRLRRRS